MSLKVDNIRGDFPVLKTKQSLVYFDNGASSLKPQVVIDKVNEYYSQYGVNVHRGVYSLSEQASSQFELTRLKVREFINAKSEKEIIFTSGTTESINLVAYTYGRKFLKKNDEIIISLMEHHSNLVPWQILCEEKGCKLKFIPITAKGELDLKAYQKLFTNKTKFVSIVYVSNSLGTINPIKDIIKTAHEHNVPILVDAAQATPHLPIDVQDLDCDFLAFSGHKMYGPTGVGVLYGKQDLLEKMPPFKGGGDMILEVTTEKSSYNDLPYKFEAGTPAISSVIGLGAAIDYLKQFNWNDIANYEKELLDYGTKALSNIKGLKLIGSASHKSPVLLFTLDGIHPHDVGSILDSHGVAIRAGHHCTMPLMNFFKVPATVRASLAMYNKPEEIDVLVEAIKDAQKIFSK